jgi:hypothetical protein
MTRHIDSGADFQGGGMSDARLFSRGAASANHHQSFALYIPSAGAVGELNHAGL